MGDATRILILSGIDSSGGAGLDVDCEVVRALGGDPIAIPTARTVQSDAAVFSVSPVDGERFHSELRERMGQHRIGAIKIGLIPNLDILRVLQRELKAGPDSESTLS